MKLLVLISLILCTLSNTSKAKKGYYDNGQLMYQVSSKDGLLDGQYLSWHENGQKKAAGQFKNNQRIGIWTVWDNTGALQTSRKYENNFKFEWLKHQDEKGTPLESPSKSDYNLNKNSAGYIAFSETKVEDVYVERNIWRTVPNSKTNEALFKNQLVEQMLKMATNNKNIKLYTPHSDDLKEALTVEALSNLKETDYELLHFKFKEVWFYDYAKQTVENRILAICPTLKTTDNTAGKDLFWVAFDDVRPLLASINTDKNTPSSNLDDLLFFRAFQSQIYKESNVYNRAISAYKSGDDIKKEAERIEMDLLDKEHDLWLVKNFN